MVEAEIWTITRIEQGFVVFLRPLNRDVSVPICIGPLEVQAILAGLGGVTVPRPLTHDLLLALMSRTGLDVLRVLIHELKDATFYAQLIMSQKHSPDILILDSRPSDALALAVRRKCPILISEAIVSEAGIPADILIGNALGPVPLQKKRSKRESLLSELNSAVAVEDYERAAEIRDILIRLEQEGD